MGADIWTMTYEFIMNQHSMYQVPGDLFESSDHLFSEAKFEELSHCFLSYITPQVDNNKFPN